MTTFEGVFRIKYVPTVRPDVLATVTDPAFVLGALVDEAELDAFVLLDLLGLFYELLPGLRRLRVPAFSRKSWR